MWLTMTGLKNLGATSQHDCFEHIEEEKVNDLVYFYDLPLTL